jgi:hypothetical protein
MKITINNKEYFGKINNRVIRQLFQEKKLDVLSDDKMQWLDDPDILEYVCLLALKEGSRFEGVKLDIGIKDISLNMERWTAIELQNGLLEEITKAWTYVIEKNKDVIEKK